MSATTLVDINGYFLSLLASPDLRLCSNIRYSVALYIEYAGLQCHLKKF